MESPSSVGSSSSVVIGSSGAAAPASPPAPEVQAPAQALAVLIAAAGVGGAAGRRHTCRICGKGFHSSQALAGHSKVHYYKKPWNTKPRNEKTAFMDLCEKYLQNWNSDRSLPRPGRARGFHRRIIARGESSAPKPISVQPLKVVHPTAPKAVSNPVPNSSPNPMPPLKPNPNWRKVPVVPNPNPRASVAPLAIVPHVDRSTAVPGFKFYPGVAVGNVKPPLAQAPNPNPQPKPAWTIIGASRSGGRKDKGKAVADSSLVNAKAAVWIHIEDDDEDEEEEKKEEELDLELHL